MTLTLVFGGSGSGKSELAERLCVRASRRDGAPARLTYVATMRDDGSREALRRVERHRRMRAGRGFETWEVPRDIAGELRRAPGALSCPGAGVALLEGLGTLCANELFDAGAPAPLDDPRTLARTAEGALGRALCGVWALRERCRDLVVVSDDLFRGSVPAQGATRAYLEVLARANRAVAERADRVVEVVCGIPLWLRGAEARGEEGL